MMMNLLKLNLLRNLLRLKAKTNLRKSLRLVVLVLEREQTDVLKILAMLTLTPVSKEMQLDVKTPLLGVTELKVLM